MGFSGCRDKAVALGMVSNAGYTCRCPAGLMLHHFMDVDIKRSQSRSEEGQTRLPQHAQQHAEGAPLSMEWRSPRVTGNCAVTPYLSLVWPDICT